VSERFEFAWRVFCALGAAALLMAARPHHPPAPHGTQSASLAPTAANATPTPAETTGAAVAIVNDAVISNYDLSQRMALFAATSGVHPNQEQMKQIRGEVLRSLVDETLQLQEAKKNNITVASADVDKALDSIAHQNNISLEQIKQMLKANGVDIATLRTQITAELAWNKLVEDQLGGRIQITDQDVNAAMQRLAEGAHRPQFLVSEIFIGVDSPDKEDKALNGANQIVQQLNLGAPFAAAARQFSQSPSAATGGDIGWVQQGQLAEELDKALSGLKPGQIAGPIKVAGGFYILQLRDRREPAGTVVPQTQSAQSTPDTGAIPLARLLLALPPKAPESLKQRALQVANGLREQINGCSNLSRIAKQIGGAVYMNLGTMRVSQLSPDLRKALANTQSGDVAQPFISSAGVEIIVRCDPKVAKIVAYQMPSRKEVENRLFQEQMSMMARRYLRDLRRDAVVEYR
jgi:peptidyl-prolyl cis-trans isomerase SurA